MSAVLDQPQAPKPEIFDSVGYFDRRVIGADVKRWVFFALDLIVPQRKSEISWLRVGGEETSCPCLQRYGRGFVPKGIPALLEMGGEPIPMRHLGDLQASAWQGIPLNEDAVKNRFGFVPVYPGDGMRVLRRYSQNDGGMRKGLDEITALQGKQWEECHTLDHDGILDVIELACYGDGMAKTLRELEDQIRFARVTDSRIDMGKYKDETLKMCDESRNWASRKVAIEHGLLKTGHVGEWQGGHTYSYSPMSEMLLDQLEIPRQDQPMQELAKMFANNQYQQSIQPQGMSAADLDLIEQRMEARLAKAREADAERIAALEAQLEGKMVTCEACGREMKKNAMNFHRARHCPVLHPKGDGNETGE